MTDNQIYKLMDLVEDIKNLDNIIQIHNQNSNDSLMLSQYQAKKIKLISFLITELNEKKETSLEGILIIKKILDKYLSPNNTSSDFIPRKNSNLEMLANAI